MIQGWSGTLTNLPHASLVYEEEYQEENKTGEVHENLTENPLNDAGKFLSLSRSGTW